jgi:hypothetical protein
MGFMASRDPHTQDHNHNPHPGTGYEAVARLALVAGIPVSIQGSRNLFPIVPIGPLNHQGQRNSSTITQDASFGPLLTAIGGSRADGSFC